VSGCTHQSRHDAGEQVKNTAQIAMCNDIEWIQNDRTLGIREDDDHRLAQGGTSSM